GERVLARIEAVAAEEKCKDVKAKILRARHAGPAIVMETEDRHMEAVILGIPYRRRFGSCSLGSTATYVFNNASCQVIFWRERAPAPLFA
ncbi:MAG: universal stress protein, partial [Chloroflexi bacterium]|nr:universal stress protein [Chloroflexota bacterium]